MVNKIVLEGAIHTDNRGSLSFFNDFDMSEVRRMYIISPKGQEYIRAWQGHQFEKKWFCCLHGSFVINLIKIDDFEYPSTTLKADKILLSENSPKILGINGGHATGIKAASPNSRLLVYSNFSTAQSVADDYRYPPGFWKANWQN